MEELTAEQSKIAKVIERAISNFRKDSPSRKTTEYLQKRLDDLEAEWQNFDVNHKRLQEFADTNDEHPYFKNQFYNQVKAGYESYRKQILSLMKLPDNITPSASAKNGNDIQGEFSFHDSGNEVNEELCKLIKTQKALIRTLTSLLQGVESVKSEEHSKSYYELKIRSIHEYWSSIFQNNQTIWALAEDPEPVGYKLEFFMETEQWVHEVLIALSQQLEQFSQPITNYNAQMKLPKVIIPTFDGNYLKWNQFADLYTQMIHNQPMSNAQKMFYLIGNLSGEARTLISHLPISEENYPSAWEILQNRYNNKRLLVTAILNKLLSQPTSTTESVTAIKTLHDVTKECILGLKNIGIDTSTWDTILVHLLLKRVDRTTHGLYEQSLEAPRELQTLTSFLDFLELRFQSLEALGNKGRTEEKCKEGKRHHHSRLSSLMSASTLNCISCKRDHPLFACERFLQLSPKGRLEFLRKNKLCINCLKSGHNASGCTSRSCLRCLKKHNTLVHPEGSKVSSHTKTQDCYLLFQTCGFESTAALVSDISRLLRRPSNRIYR